jgi:hypothetical protein
MKLNLGFLAPAALVVSLFVAGPAIANDGGIGQNVTQSSELLTISNNANKKLEGSKYKIQFFESDGELYEIKAKTHFESLPRDNHMLVGVYFYKDYDGTSTRVMYHVLADKDALNSDQARKYKYLVSSYNNKTVKQTASEIESSFVPEFDTNPWTYSGKSIEDSVVLVLCLIALGGCAYIRLVEG